MGPEELKLKGKMQETFLYILNEARNGKKRWNRKFITIITRTCHWSLL
jgi:hypothetical protein